jgi:BASS family bile acid:Na+ symporter
MSRLHHLANRYLLWLLLAAYALSALLPGPGASLRLIHIADLPWFDGAAHAFSLPSLLLAAMLFNAGLGMKVSELVRLVQRPHVLLLGLALNLVIPMGLMLVFHYLLGFWHDSLESAVIIQSLALVIAMPIAGASTAWSQNSEGNLSLSLGLVVLSTILSPITTPLIMGLVNALAHGGGATSASMTPNGSIHAFLIYSIVLPSVAGISLRRLLGESWGMAVIAPTKALNMVILLVLNYSNGSAALPGVIATPDWEFLGLSFAVVTLLCAAGFLLGWVLPRHFHATHSEQVSLMYALGMNNNGSALVIAASAFAGQPRLLLPIIAYNLTQHVVAGTANGYLSEAR